MVYAEEARKILAKYRPWIGGEFNHVTFDKLVDANILPIGYRHPNNGVRLFNRADVERLAKLMPDIRPANKKGIVNYLKEVLAKKEKRRAV